MRRQGSVLTSPQATLTFSVAPNLEVQRQQDLGKMTNRIAQAIYVLGAVSALCTAVYFALGVLALVTGEHVGIDFFCFADHDTRQLWSGLGGPLDHQRDHNISFRFPKEVT